MAAAKEPVKRVIQQVRPILSVDRDEARRRVLSLYKAWFRTVPFVGEIIYYLHQNQTIDSHPKLVFRYH
jgi:hypothetical protein